MSAIHDDDITAKEDASNLLLVDRLWKLKKACEKRLFLYIQLNRLIKDIDYRHNLMDQARALNDDKINAIIKDIEMAEKEEQRDKTGNQVTTGHSQLSASPVRRSHTSKLLLPLAWCASLLIVIGAIFLLIQQSNTASNTEAVVASRPSKLEPTSGNELADTTLPLAQPSILLRVHGSNSVGENLFPTLLDHYFEQNNAKEKLWVQSSIAVERQLHVLDANNRAFAIELHAHGTSTGFKALSSQRADVAMASRSIKDKEKSDLLPLYGDMQSRLAEHIVGLDGLAVVTYPDNPVNALTVHQLSLIFSGQITNWQQVGGQDRTIALFARDKNSGTWDTFKSLVLKPKKAELADSALRYESSSELSDSVTNSMGGIGFVALPYVKDAKLMAIAATKESLPIIPTRFTISTEDYPLSRRLYLYTPPNTTNPLIKDIIKFALSTPGQSVVEKLGLASQNIRLHSPPTLSSAPAEYRELTQKAKRLSLNFRFRAGSDTLDNKSLMDMDRLIQFMSNNSGGSLMLFGFSDSTGKSADNYELSLKRAKVVETALHSRGIAPYKVIGMGEQMPLASNATVKGREKNRRVEVWMM